MSIAMDCAVAGRGKLGGAGEGLGAERGGAGGEAELGKQAGLTNAMLELQDLPSRWDLRYSR